MMAATYQDALRYAWVVNGELSVEECGTSRLSLKLFAGN